MAKKKSSTFECQHCGEQSVKWLGKCPSCGGWDSFIELSSEQLDVVKKVAKASAEPSKATPITQIEQDNITRFSTLNEEFDLVLGGGIVPGGLTLIGGSPGVGKSTLLLKIAGNLAKSGKKVLYVSGEESAGQIKMRATRLDANEKNLYLLSEISLEAIQDELLRQDYEIAIIDSIQTIYSDKLTSSPGSVSQVREITFELMRKAKESDIAMFIIGHITKDGSIAGPRVLEHMVDTVLYFEGERGHKFRILRAVKNRFGAVNELGVFAMTGEGLREVKNPSAIFLSRAQDNVSGSVVMVIWEGTRPLLVEIQALVDDSSLGQPRRVAVGLDQNRLAMLLAVLHRHGGLMVGDQDVFVNVVGGVKVMETSADLSLLLAIVSSFRNNPLPHDLVVFGEVGLSGEIRPVPSGQERLYEAAKHGFKRAIVPKANVPKDPIEGVEIIGVQMLSEALSAI